MPTSCWDRRRSQSAVPDFDKLLAGFEFATGNRYAEWVKGDKVAAYGLTALVAGGVGAAAVKSGALGKLWKLHRLRRARGTRFLEEAFSPRSFGSKQPETQAGTAAQ